ncbi:MAG: TonB-dependent receptor [Williamsia sp.]|nr:TonB-dependent receptor [Williamsia sp.]
MQLLHPVRTPLLKKYGTVLTILLLLPAFLLAQAKPVTGTVLDETGKAVAGASVSIKNRAGGVVTDHAGKFSIAASPGDTLTVSSVNYEPMAVGIGGQTSIAVTLKAKAGALTDVVVVGYATQKKVNLTGSVATVTAKQLADRPITNVSSALAGLMPGVFVRQSSGDPRGDAATVQIRGTGTLSSASPLVIVDGIIGVMDAVNPQDIESVTVLKDAASASIYGTLAANGVILITTKKGQRNRTTVNYSGDLSFTNPMNLPKFVTDYATHMRLINEGYTNVGQSPIFAQSTINAWDSASKIPNALNPIGVPNSLAYPNTDWADVLFQNRLSQNHTVSVNGGSDKVGYLLSMGYLNNQGTIENTGTKRYQLRANLDARVNKFLTLGTQTFASTQLFEPGNTTSAFNFLRQTTPGLVPYYKGKYGFPQAPEESSTANNILGFLNNSITGDQTTRFNTTLYATLNIVKGLSLESRFNYQIRQEEYNSHTNAGPSERWNFATGEQKAFLPNLANLTTYYSFDKNRQLTFDEVLRYTLTVADNHDINAFVGYNQLYYNYYNFDATKTGLVDYNITTPGSALTPTTVTGTEYDYAIRSYFGRVNYAYKSKYLLEGNLRYDGVSRFSPQTRWGLFPSVSAGWRISEENFMGGTRSWLSNLKLRASWGQLGNNASGNYDWQATYSSRLYSFNNAQVSGLAVGSYANAGLQWETTTNREVALEGSLWHNKLSFEINAYQRVTDGILTTTPIPLTAGTASAPVINAAGVTNKGIELSLGYRAKAGAFNFNISGNVAYNTNEVTKYKGRLVQGWVKDAGGNNVYQTNLGAVSSGDVNRILEEHKINEYYLYQVYRGSGNYNNADGSVNIHGGPKDGMIRTPDDLAWVNAMKTAGYKFAPVNTVGKAQLYYGDLIYADLNNDGTYGNTNDRYFTGTSSLPKYVFGLNTDVQWRQFDLSTIWSGAAGHQYYWNADNYNNSFVTNGYAFSTLYANNHYFYDPANPSDPRTNITATYTRLKTTDPVNRAIASNFWLYNATWIKLKNLQVGYSLPAVWARRALLQRARIYFSGENLLLITKFPGLDPEIGSGVSYPTMRQYAFGVNLTF